MEKKEEKIRNRYSSQFSVEAILAGHKIILQTY